MTIYICGDSTAANYEPQAAPQTGWGQVFSKHFKDGVQIDNRATCARSAKSFIGEGRLSAIEETLKVGDYLFIQFTHNDASNLIWRHTDALSSYMDYLNVYIDTARHYGAMPILLTPICRRVDDPEHNDYIRAIRLTAASRNVPLIDVHTPTRALISAMTDEQSMALYMHVNDLHDDTHTTLAGATAFAQIVARGLKMLSLPLCQYIKEDSL